MIYKFLHSIYNVRVHLIHDFVYKDLDPHYNQLVMVDLGVVNIRAYNIW